MGGSPQGAAHQTPTPTLNRIGTLIEYGERCGFAVIGFSAQTHSQNGFFSDQILPRPRGEADSDDCRDLGRMCIKQNSLRYSCRWSTSTAPWWVPRSQRVASSCLLKPEAQKSSLLPLLPRRPGLNRRRFFLDALLHRQQQHVPGHINETSVCLLYVLTIISRNCDW